MRPRRATPFGSKSYPLQSRAAVSKICSKASGMTSFLPSFLPLLPVEPVYLSSIILLGSPNFWLRYLLEPWLSYSSVLDLVMIWIPLISFRHAACSGTSDYECGKGLKGGSFRIRGFQRCRSLFNGFWDWCGHCFCTVILKRGGFLNDHRTGPNELHFNRCLRHLV